MSTCTFKNALEINKNNYFMTLAKVVYNKCSHQHLYT